LAAWLEKLEPFRSNASPKPSAKKGIVNNIDRPWAERDHALFVAYAPVKRPRYAISVVVEHGGSGSSTAAPVARDILTQLMQKQG
jgi:penicillin-binding protein 2